MADTNHRTERDLLTKDAYATDEHLLVRYRTHELYSQPPIDFPKWVIETFQWRGDEWVLDLGAGPGLYFNLIREHTPQGHLVAGDLSWGMARQARNTHNSVLNLDAEELPFADGTFDVVLANHMLYHVSDIEHTLDEIQRTLRPDGCVVAATNSADTMPEFDTLARRACTLLGYPKQRFKPAHVKFSLENGPVLLAHYFRAVARYDFPSAFHFTEVEPVMAYLNSLQPLRSFDLPESVPWEDFMDVMEKQITRLIRHFGELQVHKLAGVLVGTNGGGFATDYLQHLDSTQTRDN
jgi:ubiquinone/menaquinone biosynthesis C-methylase UbiE